MLQRMVLVFALLAGCSNAEDGTRVVFALDEDLHTGATFFDFPWPSDLRLVDGKPDVAGWPDPRGIPLVGGLVTTLAQRTGFPVMPVSWMRFTDALPPQDLEAVIAPTAEANILLIDVDAGTAVPVVASTLPVDDYLPPNVL